MNHCSCSCSDCCDERIFFKEIKYENSETVRYTEITISRGHGSVARSVSCVVYCAADSDMFAESFSRARKKIENIFSGLISIKK